MHAALAGFHPIIQRWFASRFAAPTPAQELGWPAIASGQHTLIAAPTGSGKTLAAFMTGLDALVRQSLADPASSALPDATQLLYISPLKALANDVQRNLLEPLAQITVLAQEMGTPIGEVRVSVRTGDTSASERMRHARRSPHILITTPESLYILLTSERGRRMLKSVRTLILDELHAVAPNKRGAHLALSVERLCHLVEHPVTRIGLSATQHPIEEVARFLTGGPGTPAMSPVSAAQTTAAGDDCPSDGAVAAQAVTAPLPEGQEDGRATSPCQGVQRGEAPLPGGKGGVPPSSALSPLPGKEGGQGDGRAPDPHCAIVNTGHRRAMDVGIELPQGFELGPIATHEEWAQVLDQVAALVRAHKTTLVFVNTRRLVERVAHLMSERLGDDQVVAHHGSLSREKRFDAEQRLKNGAVKLCVATASLELGIDIGDVDLVCQIGSPRNIGVALQRVGRSGHQVSGMPKGRFFPLTRDELVETVALLRAIAAGTLDALRIPEWPLDILAQQVVAACVNEEWAEDALFDLVRRAYPYRALPRARFDQVIAMLSEGVATRWGRGTAHLHRDGIHHRVKARRGARIVATTGGGAIPDTADYLVVAEPDGTLVGSVNEDFAIESMAGDVFLLGNTPWRIRRVEAGTVRVEAAQGQAPTIPFWLGEAPGRTVELSAEVSAVRQAVADVLPDEAAAVALLAQAGASREAAEQVVAYIAEGKRVLGMVPTIERVVAERFFDEAGGMQLVIHAPFGSRINRAWGLALRKRFCAGFDFELQAAATDEGINISLGPQHSFPVEEVFRYLKKETAQDVLTQAVLQSPLFPTRWRWDATRALALLRFSGGKRVPTAIQRMRSDDLMAAVFPALAACQDNREPGPIEVPDHPLTFEALRDSLTEALDANGFLDVLRRLERGDIAVYGRDTVQPSAFSHQILNAMPYAFLDDAPLEERRARAVTLRRALPEHAADLGALDAQTIDREVANAWPPVRDADELHDALLSLGVLPADVVALRGSDAASPEPQASLPACPGRWPGPARGAAGQGGAWPAWHAALVADGRAGTLRVGERSLWLAAERGALVAAAYPDGVRHARDLADTPASPPHGEGVGASRAPTPTGATPLADPEAAVTAIVRGWAEVTGPFTVAELSSLLALAEPRVQQAVLQLETDGLLLRGQFRPTAVAGDSTEFCDRRLLARIHRATISRLRHEVEPVPPASYVRFLLEWQHVAPGTQAAGDAGLLEVIEQLQGYEAAAAVWEQALLPARVKDYAPAMLDSLCFGGEVVWGRFARRAPATTVTAGLSRNGPVSLALRDEVPWLLDPVPADGPQNVPLSGAAQDVLAHLHARGASFLPDVVSGTRRLPSDVEDALWQLVAAGLVTADGFGALRGLVTGLAHRAQRASRFRRRARGRVPSSRWALLRADSPSPRSASVPRPGANGQGRPDKQDEGIAEARAAQLLRRYGVVTRELLAREPMAASVGGWRPLLSALRRAEARGEVRGGRFIAGLVGEQFALPEAVEQLRAVHRKAPSGAVVRLSACDPLNLVGIIVPGARVPATAGNSVAYRDGVPLAAEGEGQVA